MKEAILLYMAKREKVKVHKEVSKIAETVNKTYKTSISGHTVMRHVETGMVGQSPLKMQPGGGIQKDVFKLQLTVFETFVRIKKINAESN